MKKTVYTMGLLMVILMATAATGRAQIIDLRLEEGNVIINDKVMPTSALPAGLTLEGINFRMSLAGLEEIVVEIDGRQYVVSESSIESTTGSHEPEIRIRPNSGIWSYEVVGLERRALPGRNVMERIMGAALNSNARLQSFSGDLDAVSPFIRVESLDSLFREELFFEADSTLRITLHTQGRTANEHYNILAEVLREADYLLQLQALDEELYSEVRAELDLEAESLALVARIKSVQQEAERNAMAEELRKQLEVIFEMKQDNRRREIEQLESELERLKDRMNRRRAARDRLIQQRMNELLRDGSIP